MTLRLSTLAGIALAAATPAQADMTPPFPTDEVLRDRYALPASRFVTIAGETVHFADEGKGPAILLLQQRGDMFGILGTNITEWLHKHLPLHMIGLIRRGPYQVPPLYTILGNATGRF